MAIADHGAGYRSALRKAELRLVPFLALFYLVSFLDRVNVGFAALTMNADLGLSASTFGLGAGIYFIGYVAFAMPANVALQRFGARRWLGTIGVVWGLLSMSVALVRTPSEFLALRFALGVAEAGFFPGVIYYMSLWFPDAVRGRIIGRFFITVPLSSILGAPLSTWLLSASLFGLKGWQTMFLVEALPALFLGAFAFMWLTDTPTAANWLSVEERAALHDARHSQPPGASTCRSGVFASPWVWLLGAIGFLLNLSLYGLTFFAPQILRDVGRLSPAETGLAVAACYIAAAIVMPLWAARSDRRRERMLHILLPAGCAAIAFLLAAHAPSLRVALPALGVAAAGMYAIWPIFWTLPPRILSGVAASGIAMVNSIGNIAGYLGPVIMGRLKDATGGYSTSLTMLSLGMFAAGLLTIRLRAALPD